MATEDGKVENDTHLVYSDEISTTSLFNWIMSSNNPGFGQLEHALTGKKVRVVD